MERQVRRHDEFRSNRSGEQKYRDLLSLGLELEAADQHRFEDYDANHQYLLFEFVFALGRCLKQQFPRLFGRSREISTDVESLGFTLVTLASGLKISQLSDFSVVLDHYASADDYYSSLLEAARFVESALEPCVASDGSRTPKKDAAHRVSNRWAGGGSLPPDV